MKSINIQGHIQPRNRYIDTYYTMQIWNLSVKTG